MLRLLVIQQAEDEHEHHEHLEHHEHEHDHDLVNVHPTSNIYVRASALVENWKKTFFFDKLLAEHSMRRPE